MVQWWSEGPINLPVYSGYIVARNRNQLWLVSTEKILLKGCWVIHRIARLDGESDTGNGQEPREAMNINHSQTSIWASLAGMLLLSQGTRHAGAGPGWCHQRSPGNHLWLDCVGKRNVPTVSGTKLSSDPVSLLTCSKLLGISIWLSEPNNKIKWQF